MVEGLDTDPGPLEIQDWGKVEYEEALRRQRAMAEERIADQGQSRIRLQVAENNWGAMRFYLCLGYRQVGRIPDYYTGRLDALLLEKTIGPGAKGPPKITR